MQTRVLLMVLVIMFTSKLKAKVIEFTKSDLLNNEQKILQILRDNKFSNEQIF